MGLEQIPLDHVKPPKHKLRRDIGDLSDLKASLTELGLLEPIIVRTTQLEKWELVAGHRRYLAAKELGWENISAVIIDVDDKKAFEISLVENIQRKTLDPYEEAYSFKQYVMDKGYGSITQLAKNIGVSHGLITNRLRLLNLPQEVETRISTGILTVSHGQEIARLEDKDKAVEVADLVQKVGLDTEETRKTVDLVKQGLPANKAVKYVVDFPNWTPTHTPHPFDPVKIAREQITLWLQKALKGIDVEIAVLSEVEAQKWIHEVRYPLHELVGTAQQVSEQFE